MRQGLIIRQFSKNDNGFTMIELLISIVLLALIAAAFLNSFVFATKANVKTNAVVEEGYIAQACMEDIYNLSLDKIMTELKAAMVIDGYAHNQAGDVHTFTKVIEGYYVKIQLTVKAYPGLAPELTKVKIGVYTDSAYTQLKASIQNIINIY